MHMFDVTIAGELNLDLILYGVPEEIPPERELLVDDVNLTLGSSSAIVAHNLASLGNRIGFITSSGDDAFGNLARSRLSAARVDISRACILAGRKSGLTVILRREGWRNMLTYPGTMVDLSLADLDMDYLSSGRHFHLSSYYLQRGLQSDMPKILERLKSAGLSVSLDCNDDPRDGWDGRIREALRYVDIFLPNEREARKLTGAADLESAARELARLVPTIVVKLGAEGALARRADRQWFRPSLKVEVVDSVGAGDSFNAGFLHLYLRGGDLETCLAAGNVAAALSLTRPGGTEAFGDVEHRERFLREYGWQG